MMPEQAAYDVKSYDLDLRINPQEQSIKGALTAHALVVHPVSQFVLDLDTTLTVDSVALVDARGRTQQPLKYERREGKLWIAFQMTKQPGEQVRVRVAYGHTQPRKYGTAATAVAGFNFESGEGGGFLWPSPLRQCPLPSA